MMATRTLFVATVRAFQTLHFCFDNDRRWAYVVVCACARFVDVRNIQTISLQCTIKQNWQNIFWDAINFISLSVLLCFLHNISFYCFYPFAIYASFCGPNNHYYVSCNLFHKIFLCSGFGFLLRCIYLFIFLFRQTNLYLSLFMSSCVIVKDIRRRLLIESN